MEEAAVLSLLSHSSIVCFLGFEPLPSYHYLVLEVTAIRSSSVSGVSFVSNVDFF